MSPDTQQARHDAEVRRARQELRESPVMDHVRELVGAAPPLGPEQRLRIRAILCNPEGGKPQADAAVVYYAKRDGLIKIGTTNFVWRRMEQLGAQLLATEPGGRSVESERHQRFAQCRAHGEWFRPDPELLAYIDALAEG